MYLVSSLESLRIDFWVIELCSLGKNIDRAMCANISRNEHLALGPNVKNPDPVASEKLVRLVRNAQPFED